MLFRVIYYHHCARILYIFLIRYVIIEILTAQLFVGSSSPFKV